MPNSAKFNIDSPAGSHSIFLEQDVKVLTTIHCTFDGAAHDLTDMSGNSSSAKGMMKIAFWNDAVAIMLDATANTITMIISGYKTFSGVVTAGQMARAQAFLKACALPPLAE